MAEAYVIQTHAETFQTLSNPKLCFYIHVLQETTGPMKKDVARCIGSVAFDLAIKTVSEPFGKSFLGVKAMNDCVRNICLGIC